jgi:hypothetical protein
VGLNYNYLLYFKRDRLWDVLLGLSDYCDTDGMKPTTIQFPDHDLVIPLTSSWGEKNVIPYDQPEFELALSMNFEEDEAILDYLRNRDGDQFDRSPPEDGQVKVYSIGFIYLTVYTDLSQHYGFKKPSDMVLFKFGTTGTKMSFLFADSTSIRNTFIDLLARYKGLIGIFDWENDYGELFWFKGKHLQFSISRNYLLPEEIELELQRGY